MKANNNCYSIELMFSQQNRNTFSIKRQTLERMSGKVIQTFIIVFLIYCMNRRCVA